MGSAQFDQATDEYTKNEALKQGKELILREKPGYVTDEDAEADDLMALTDHMRTKDVRGKAKKTLARGKDLAEAQKMCQGN